MSIQYVNNNEYSTGSSRYQVLRLIVEDEKYRYLETYNQVKVPETENDVYHAVEATEENRLDIISETYYSTPKYWWAIALANNMTDPYSVAKGTILRIPSLAALSDYRSEILTRRDNSV